MTLNPSTTERRGWILWGAILAGLVGVLVFSAWRRMTDAHAQPWDQYRDFYEFFSAAKVLHEHGTTAEVFAAGKLGYVYPPLLAVLLLPLVPLGLHGAALVWTLISAAVLVVTVIAGGRAVAERFSIARLAMPVGVIASVLLADKLLAEFKMQQSNTLMLACWCAGLALFRRRPLAAGAALGFAANIKYITLLTVPYLLVRRRWAAAASTLAATLAWALAPALVLGWSKNMELLTGALKGLLSAAGDSAATPDAARVMSMQSFGLSITSAVMRWTAALGHTSLALPLVALMAGGVLAACWALYRRAGVPFWRADASDAADDAAGLGPIVVVEWTGLIVGALAFSPQTNPRHLVQALPVIMMLCAAFVTARTPRLRVLAAAGAAVIVMGFSLPPVYGGMRPAAVWWHEVAGPCWCLLAGWMLGLWVVLKGLRRGVIPPQGESLPSGKIAA